MNNSRERQDLPAEVSHHESKKEALIESVIRRVHVLSQFKQTIESVSEDETGKDVMPTIQAVMERIEASFTEAQRGSAVRVGVLIVRMKQKLAELEALDMAGTDSPDRVALLEELCKIDEEGQMQTLDEDAYFLWHLHETVAGLAKKQALVNEFANNPSLIYTCIAEKMNVQPDTVRRYMARARVVLQSFSAHVILPRERYNQIPWAKETYGIHLDGTPVNLVMHNEKPSTEEIVRHENTHNVLDSAPGFGGQFVNRMAVYFKALRSSKIPQEEKEAIKQMVLQKKPHEAVIDLQNEMLASMQAYGHAQFFQQGRFGSVYKVLKSGDFEGVARAFETAGDDALTLVRLLEAEAKRTKDEQMAEFCTLFVVRFKALFLKAVEDLQMATEVADRLGGEALTFTESAAYVLKPTSYGHLDKIQEAQFGVEETRRVRASYACAKNFTISLAGMRQVSEYLRLNPDGLLKRDREIISAKLVFHLEHDWVQVESMGIYSVADLRSYKELLQEYVVWSTEQVDFLNLYQDIVHSFVQNRFVELAKSTYAALPELFEELDAMERTVCLDVITKTITEEVDKYILTGDLPDDMVRRLENHPLWGVAKTMGVEEILRVKVGAHTDRDY